MSYRSYWKASTLETSNLLLAVVAGTLIERSLINPLPLFELEGALGAIVVVALLTLRKYSRPAMHKFGSIVLRILSWIVAVLAGVLFGNGLALVRLFWPVGILVIGVSFAFIVSAIRLSKIVTHDWELKKVGVKD